MDGYNVVDSKLRHIGSGSQLDVVNNILLTNTPHIVNFIGNGSEFWIGSASASGDSRRNNGLILNSAAVVQNGIVHTEAVVRDLNETNILVSTNLVL